MEKILVIQTAFIGDAILTLPMIQELKKLNPDTPIDVIAIPSTLEIFSSSPFVNEIIQLDKKGEHRSFSKLLKFCKNIRERNYSRIYSPHRSFRTAFIVLQSQVRETYGFSNSSLVHTYKNIIKYNPDDHEVKRNLSLIGVNFQDEEWRIPPVVTVPAASKNNVSQFLNMQALKDFIAIAPGSVWKTKIYPEEYFKEIISYFSSNKLKVLLIGSEKEIELCNSLASGLPNVVSSAGKFSLVENVELLKYARLLISNDSAPAHLGQISDVPVLTLYCSTVPSIGFYPYNSKSSWLSYDDLFCKPCGIHGRNECPIKTFECGFKLTPEIVLSKIKEMLDNDKK